MGLKEKIHDDNELRFDENHSYTFEETTKCMLTTNISGNYFYLDTGIIKSDITDGQKGIPLLLGFKIVDADTCKKITNAYVDVWQCNALGKYSGFNESENEKILYLRGRQKTDDLGFVEFTSIYPGIYNNRTNHINIKVFINDREVLTTQLFFPQEFNDYVMTLSPYKKISLPPTKNINDPIIKKYNGAKGCWPKVSPFGTKFIATLTIGVTRVS